MYVQIYGSFLDAANDIGNLIPFTEFYNESLDHWDLMSDFQQWQTPTVNAGFSFCQYPFILSITGKKTILEGNSEQQMIATARVCPAKILVHVGTITRVP